MFCQLVYLKEFVSMSFVFSSMFILSIDTHASPSEARQAFRFKKRKKKSLDCASLWNTRQGDL